RLVAAWQAAVERLASDRDAAFSALAGFVAGDRARFEAALAGIELPAPALQRALLGGELAVVAERLAAVMREHRLLGTSHGRFTITAAVFELARP
ncbi:MAG: hypothetical protein RLW62_01500, partial [Gammaproteobacteria bacterium]